MLRTSLLLLILYFAAPRFALAQLPSTAQGLLQARGMRWSSIEAPGLRLHFQAGSPSVRDSARLRVETTAARTHVLRLADETAYPTIDVFFVDSRTTLRRMAGARARGIAMPAANYVVLAYSDSMRSSPPHEIMHVVTLNRWGQSPRTGPWLGEGVAAYADQRCLEYTVDEIAAYLHRRKQLLPDRALFERFVAADDLIAYVQAGSLAGYLMATYGTETVKRVWTEGNATLPKGATDGWRKWLETVPARSIDWGRLARSGC